MPKFTGYQIFVVAILAFLQFTLVLDFMILSPLGAILMPELNITTQQFGLVVSIYAFSAGASGLLAAGFADRFDRKKLLLFFYTGFVVGTFLCAIATDYRFLLGARMITGIFGGVIGAVSFAITTDLFPYEMRGRVMGVIQTSFAVSQIMGIPAGLFLSNHWGWHAPFMMIVVVSILVGAVIAVYLRPLNAHLLLKSTSGPWRHLMNTVSRPRYLQAFATTALLSTGGYMMMPFSSAFAVNNLKIDLEHLPLVYLFTGICNIAVAPLIGRLADSLGKFTVFASGSLLTIATVIIYTNLGETPIALVILVSVLMFAGITSRMISASALMSAIPDPAHRGSFMSVSSSLQQISGGFAAALAGMIVVQNGAGPLQNFDVLGYVVVGATGITVILMYFVNRYVSGSVQSHA